MEQHREANPRNIKIIAVIIVALIIMIFLILSFQRLFRTNPYGPEIIIDNFDEYYSIAPQEKQDYACHYLYEAVLLNLPEDQIPKSGAIIRENTAELEHNAEKNSYYGSFIVDIPKIEQSYRIQITWSIGKNNYSTSTDYSALVTCLKSSEIIYPNFDCRDLFTADNEASDKFLKEYPLAAKLPIDIEYYTGGHGAYVHYTITSARGESSSDNSDGYSVVITDYTGDNYEPALERIRSLGFNPDDYEIEYKDLSEEYAAPGYAGD